jgi:hypothetical protein
MKKKELTAVELFAKWNESNREATFKEFTSAFEKALEMHQAEASKTRNRKHLNNKNNEETNLD